MPFHCYLVAINLLIISIGPAVAAAPDIFSADWGVKAKPSVVEQGFDKAAVAAFVDKYAGDPEEPLRPEQIGASKWMDINQDGTYEFLVTVSSSRAFYNTLYLYKSSYSKAKPYQTLGTWMLSDLDKSIEDLNGDGQAELVLPQLLTEYRGAGTLGVLPAVYRWNGAKYEDASAQFRDFYLKRVLPEVEARIQAEHERSISTARYETLMPNEAFEHAQRERQLHEEALATLAMVKDKILRLTGQDPLAGVEQARAWADSTNPDIRRNAIIVLREVKGPLAKTYLERLAADPDRSVAEAAKRALANFSK